MLRADDRARGFSLVEVLVALVLATFMALTLARLQAHAHRIADDAAAQARATRLAGALARRLQAMRPPSVLHGTVALVGAEHVGGASDRACGGDPPACDAARRYLATIDAAFEESRAQGRPDAAQIGVRVSPWGVTIAVGWRDRWSAGRAGAHEAAPPCDPLPDADTTIRCVRLAVRA